MEESTGVFCRLLKIHSHDSIVFVRHSCVFLLEYSVFIRAHITELVSGGIFGYVVQRTEDSTDLTGEICSSQLCFST